jgi:hypothetical protein
MYICGFATRVAGKRITISGIELQGSVWHKYHKINSKELLANVGTFYKIKGRKIFNSLT